MALIYLNLADKKPEHSAQGLTKLSIRTSNHYNSEFRHCRPLNIKPLIFF
jgi:hypothetical protein